MNSFFLLAYLNTAICLDKKLRRLYSCKQQLILRASSEVVFLPFIPSILINQSLRKISYCRPQRPKMFIHPESKESSGADSATSCYSELSPNSKLPGRHPLNPVFFVKTGSPLSCHLD